MITTTWTKTPADLLGLGGSVMPRCADVDLRTGIGVSPATRVAPFQGTAVSAGSTAARLRPAFEVRPEVQVSAWNTSAQNTSAQNASAHNSIGTTLGICSSRRPQS